MVSYPAPQEVAEGDAFYQVVGKECSLPIQCDEDGQWLEQEVVCSLEAEHLEAQLLG